MNNGALAYAGSPVQVESSHFFERILFTTDFSETSLRALPAATALARTFGSALKLMYVLTPGDEICAAPEFAPDVREVVRNDASARLLTLKDSIQAKEVNVSTEVYRGRLNSLSDKIAADEIDLVVLATHGNKGFRHLLLGSIAEDVIHSAACPVLTIGPHANMTIDSEFRPKHVLFATDASPDSFRVLPYALEFAKRSGSLALLHVLGDIIKKRSPDAESFAASMRDSLYQTLPSAAIKNCNPEVVVRFGNTVEQILNAARELRSELIVMGAHSNKT